MMFKSARATLSLFLVCLLSFSTHAFASHQRFNQIIFFGDSLTDNGNLYNRTYGYVPKSPPYYEGRFSNGPTWAELVATHYTQTENILSANFGVGSETAVFHNPAKGYLPYTLSMSVSDYLWRYTFSDKSKTLFVFLIGANDYMHGSSDIEGDTAAVVDSIKYNLDKLYDYGGRNFLIVNLPDLARTPFGSAQPNKDELHQLALEHNSKSFKLVLNEQWAHPESQFKEFDFYNMFVMVMLDIDKYNKKYNTHITDLTTACWNGGYTLKQMTAAEHRKALIADIRKHWQRTNKTGINLQPEQLADAILQSPALSAAEAVRMMYDDGELPCTNEDEHIFWDAIHPTRAMHSMLSQMVIEFIDSQFD